MKRLLVIGAMKDATALSMAAKALGFHVVNFRNEFFAVPNPYADECRDVDLFDREAVLSAARGIDLDGVLANADHYAPVAAYVGEQLGLTANRPDAVAILRSKFAFRERMRQCGLFAPKGVCLTSETEIPEKLTQLNYPVIIKPICGNGSFGVRRFDAYDACGMTAAYRECMGFPQCQAAVAEEYVEPSNARAIEAEVFVHRGTFVWGGIFTCSRSRVNPLLPMTDFAPADLAGETERRFREATERVLKEVGATFGEFNIEAFETRGGEVFLIEINPRQGGDRLPWLSYRHSGVDMTRLLLTTAVGDDSYFDEIVRTPPQNRPVMCHSVFARAAGTYAGLVVRPGFPGREIGRVRHKACGAIVTRPKWAKDEVETVYFDFETVDEMMRVRDRMEEWVWAEVIPRRWYHRLDVYRRLKWGPLSAC